MNTQNLTKIKQAFGLEAIRPKKEVSNVKHKFGMAENSFVPSTENINANAYADNNSTSNGINIINKVISRDKPKQRERTVTVPTPTVSRSAALTREELSKRTKTAASQWKQEGKNEIANFEGGTGANLSGWNTEQLKNTDLTQLPKLSEGQITSLINKFFSSEGSVMNASDAAGLYQAQAQSGISALALLGIGALESGYGTSNIARQKGNLWGWGAVNSNPMGGAKTFSSNAGAAAVEYANNLKSLYYNDRGATSIYAIGTGDNPSGLGYAYYDDGSINKSWADQVASIMGKFAQSLGSTGVSGGTGGAQAANIAKKYLGTPYVWGGSTPDGFDCSGLVQYVYKQMGYDISRTTYTQINEGKAVSKDNLKVGDLVFFGDGSSPHHVGIYTGNGQYIHAPSTGDIVKISNLNSRSDFAGARRIIE